MKFGVWIPSYCYPDLSYQRAQTEVGDFARKANDLGIDLWVIDHLLHAPGLYGMPWLEPMTTLTWAAALAPDVSYGTGILVLPLRNPVILAKEIATLDYLTGGRFIFGIGGGWDPDEFRAVGTRIEERGKRTDEILAAVRMLLTQDDVTFDGKYYQFENVTIQPRPPKMPEVWVAGGSRIPDPEFHDLPVLSKAVLNRILDADAWISRCSGNQEWIKRDWGQIKEGLAARGRPRRFAEVRPHELHVHRGHGEPREGARDPAAVLRTGDGIPSDVPAPAGVLPAGHARRHRGAAEGPRVGRLRVRGPGPDQRPARPARPDQRPDHLRVPLGRDAPVSAYR